jgi:hypothetical protein
MLMQADNEGVDHLDSGIMGRCKCVYDAAPVASEQSGCSKWCTGRTTRADHAKALLIA